MNHVSLGCIIQAHGHMHERRVYSSSQANKKTPYMTQDRDLSGSEAGTIDI